MSSEQLFPKLGDVTNAATAESGAGAQDGELHGMQEVKSLCMRCHDEGTTRLLLTAIPYFKEIIISSFTCDHCGYRDTEIQSAGEIQRKLR